MVSHRAIHGHVLVPASFVIPLDDDDDDDAWPAETRGVPLGSIVQRLRLRRDFLQGEDASDRRAQLDGLGFVWDVGERNFDTFVRALRHFDRLEGRRFDQMEGGGGGRGRERWRRVAIDTAIAVAVAVIVTVTVVVPTFPPRAPQLRARAVPIRRPERRRRARLASRSMGLPPRGSDHGREAEGAVRKGTSAPAPRARGGGVPVEERQRCPRVARRRPRRGDILPDARTGTERSAVLRGAFAPPDDRQ